jgi:RHS repeat-associated protein
VTPSVGSTPNPYRYVGAAAHMTDPSGLQQLGARFYWPEVGRFVQQDPIGDGVNWYAYVANNPVVGVDPHGLFEVFGLVEGEVAAGLGIDLSIALTIDFSHGWESGLYKSQGPEFGLSEGGGYGGGLAVRDVEGEALNLDINAEIASGTFSWDDQGLNSIAATIGPGIGAAWSVTQTTPIVTAEQVRDLVISSAEGLWGSLPWVRDPCRQ